MSYIILGIFIILFIIHIKKHRYLNFNYNMINKIEGLQHCKMLEELYLEGNKISIIEELEGLLFLKRLELG